MKIKFIILYFITSIFLISSLYASVEDEIIFGTAIDKFSKINQNKIKRLSGRLLDEFEKNSILKLDISFVGNKNLIKKEFKEFKKFNSYVGYSTYFLENIDFFIENGKRPFVFADSKNDLSQYYLVASRKSGIKTISDLKGKVLNSMITTSYYQVWLDYLVLKEFKKSYSEIIKDIIIEEKDNKKLLNIYFNKADFTVVSKSVYDDVALLNPSIVKNLIIIKKSEPIFYFAMGVFHKKTPEQLIDAFFYSLSEKNMNSDVSNIYNLIGIKSIEKKEFSSFRKLVDFYEEYKKLKGVK